MKYKRSLIQICLLGAVLLALPPAVQAQFTYNGFNYTTNNGAITITGYTGPAAVTIPSTILVNGVSLPVTSIGDNAFYSDFSLTSVTIPNSVTSIGEQVFVGCYGLTAITVDAQNAFYCSVNGVLFDKGTNTVIQYPNEFGGTSYSIPNSVTSIGEYAFSDTRLHSVTIPNSVTNIGGYAFDNSSSLTSVTIPNSVTSIGGYAFEGTSLTSITIPNSVTSIGDYAFNSDVSLKAITADTNNPDYSSVNGVLFNKGQTTLIMFPDGLGGSYTIPNSVTNIGVGAFEDCSILTNITILNSVTSIGNYAFNDCTNLTSVTIPSGVTSIGVGAFEDCSSLTNITIPSGVTNIGDYAFNDCTNLTSVTIPSGVTSIGVGAFEDCSSLTNITIPNRVTSIGNYAFYSCTSLTSLTIRNGVTNIGVGAFEDCTSLTSLTIPNSVTSIGDYAFAYCSSLTSVYFLGNAPSADLSTFSGWNETAYYLPGTVGWGVNFTYLTDLQTALWFQPNPLILYNGTSFGVQNSTFGFTISWATNIPVVIEACTNLAHPVWVPVATNTLTGGSSYFSDPQWTNYHSRFYRLSSQ